MGHEIEKVARNRGIKVVSIIDPNDKSANFKEISKESVRNADVCIDFTNPDAVLENIRKMSEFRKNIVVGTTGWNNEIAEVKNIVKKNNIGFIYASNFSLGVNVFFKIVENAAKIINNVDAYDVFGYELHHSKKLDAPSGTAKTIGQILVSNIHRKKDVTFAVIRSGFIPGTHVVGFDSAADTIELKHAARNREGFALGAIMAAEWINGKKGFYEINDMMKEIIGG